MSPIGGPGGIGGAHGPGGPRGPSGPDGPSGIDDVAGDAPIEPPHAAGALEALAADVAAGRLTQREALDRLVEAAAGPELEPSERAELRELLRDLVANDPHLRALAGRI